MKKTRANKSALELKLARIRVLSSSNLGGVRGGLKLPPNTGGTFDDTNGGDCVESACPNGTCDSSKITD